METCTRVLTAYLQRYAQRKAAFPCHPQDSPRRARRLLDLWGAPDRGLLIVRVVGTKGKGSTAAMLAAIVQAAGYSVGLFTSPHLHSPRERIQVAGRPIGRAALDAALATLYKILLGSLAWDDIGPATLFEGLTALAAAHFAQRGVDLAVFEAGMGGRSDATHALDPLLTLLTPIALDHQAYLGATLEAIAAEKAGAIPPGGVVLSAPQPPAVQAVIAARCREVGAMLWGGGFADLPPRPSDLLPRPSDLPPRPPDLPPRPPSLKGGGGLESGTGAGGRPASGVKLTPMGGDTSPGLQGPHQAVNAGLALAAVDILREMGWSIPQEAAVEGLRGVHWPGRLETVAGRPLTLVDAAHNPAAAEALAAALAAGWPQRPRILLLGCSADKDLAGIAAALAPLTDGVVLTRAQHHRAAAPEEMAVLWQAHGVPTEIVPAVPGALPRARAWAGPAGLVCACGSFFVVAEVREALGLAVREAWPEPMGDKEKRQ